MNASLYITNIISLLIIAACCFFIVLHPKINPSPHLKLIIGIIGIVSIGAFLEGLDHRLNPYLTVGFRVLVAIYSIIKVREYLRKIPNKVKRHVRQ